MRAAVIGIVLLGASRAYAGVPALLPPLEIELGGAAISTEDGRAIGATQLLVGISWASLCPEPTRLDASIGVIAIWPTEVEGSPTSATGGFLDLAARVFERRHVRGWLGGRGELMSADGAGVLGGALRGSLEVWAPTVAVGRGAGILGTVAVAVWAELGVRERADRSLASTAAAGIGVRLPFVAVK